MDPRQRWRIHKAGNIANLILDDTPLGPLAEDQVRVHVQAVGLNFADIFALTGLYSATPSGPFTPGLEFAGTVDAIGARVADYRPGDRVMGVTRFGGYTTRIDSPEGYLRILPDHWSMEQGAAYLAQTLTAWYALTELGQVRPGHRVLIHSAAGGVGLQAMKLCQALGAHPVGTVSHIDKQDFLHQAGFEAVLVREKDFAAQLRRHSLQFDLVLDAIGGHIQKASFDALDAMGRLVVFGAAEFTPSGQRPDYLRALWRYLRRPRYDVMDMISSNRSVMAFNLIWLWEQQDTLQRLLDALEKVQISPPHVGHHFAFEQAHQALDCLRSGKTVGKVVLIQQ
ncbi:zinc-containing alcohol dehydrogenase [Alcanivorax hongdengensis A-11-3]|uniref:Zinc-containing alcohol dehydrogenase n=1 Tax=Alcanivorax hongdengensis A-11-3 TaxID=1177179 RepID=L0WG15_9GAMM|nr:medium chain dehydrogenase/reductase family protein [Alcanivorax hongdengensis]EKF75659.1 zinc-containing alcohol dehydrogenase [Alcanivorax hongdengensis A-11-3]